MTTLVEVKDLKKLDKPLLEELKRYTFKYDGWMLPCMNQILRGYAKTAVWNSVTGDVAYEKKPLAYSEASAVIARDESGEILGWAFVRHPQKRTSERILEWNHSTFKWEWNGKFRYAGRRSDFMVFVRNKHRKKGVARALLIVAYYNFGKLDAYPHDRASEKFYDKNKKFVVANHTDELGHYDYKLREVA